MSFWNRLFGPRFDIEGFKKTLEHRAEIDKLEQQIRMHEDSAVRQREIDRLTLKMQPSAECKACAALKASQVALSDLVLHLQAALKERDEMIARFHGAGWQRAMAESELAITKLQVEKDAIAANGHVPANDADERGAHAGRVDFEGSDAPRVQDDAVMESF